MSYTAAEQTLYDEQLAYMGGKEKVLISIYKEAQDNIEAMIAKYRQDIESGKIISDFVIPRQEALYSQISQEIDRLYFEMSVVVQDGFSDVYNTTYYTHAYNIEAAINAGAENYSLNFPQLSGNAARVALDAEIAGHTFLERIAQDKMAMQFRIRTEVAQAIIQGQTKAQLSKDLQSIDAVFKASKAKADMTAQTEMLRAFSYGQDISRLEAEAAGVKFEYKWSAALDGKTRPDHIAMDGKKAAIVDGEPVFTLPDGSQGAGPRMEGLPAGQVIRCRCRRLDLPYGMEPTARSAKLPDGSWKTVPGNTTAAEWAKKYYGYEAA